MAIRLMTRIKRDLGVRFDLSTIFDASTVSLLAARIRGERPEIDVELAASGGPDAVKPRVGVGRSGPAHGAQATRDDQLPRDQSPVVRRTWRWWQCAVPVDARPSHGWETDQIHAFQAVGVNDGEIPDRSIEEMASRYVAELRAHSSGPYLLGGYSGGGIVALEMARQLRDSMTRWRTSSSSTASRPGHRGQTVASDGADSPMRAVRSGPADVAPYVKRNTMQSLRRFVPERTERVQEHQTQEHVLGYVTDDTGFVNLYHYFSAAAERYQLARYDVDVTVLKADHVWPVHRDDYYWRDHVDRVTRVVQRARRPPLDVLPRARAGACRRRARGAPPRGTGGRPSGQRDRQRGVI